MDPTALPSFTNPPVVETVLGVQFDPIAGFSNAHLGVFWKYWKHLNEGEGAGQQWNSVRWVPALEQSFERFDEGQWAHDHPLLRLSNDASGRLQIQNDRQDAMIQIQNGRLHYNWTGRSGQTYRRYVVVRPEFDRVWAALQGFLAAEGLQAPVPNQWEVTYVNHIPKGTVWNSPEDWPDVVSGLLKSIPATCVKWESLSHSWHFEIPEHRGRLHIDLRHARRNESGEEILDMKLTARGPISPTGGLNEGLDLGRFAIVLTFREVTSELAHRAWGIQS